MKETEDGLSACQTLLLFHSRRSTLRRATRSARARLRRDCSSAAIACMRLSSSALCATDAAYSRMIVKGRLILLHTKDATLYVTED